MKITASFEPADTFVTLDELRRFVRQLDSMDGEAQVHLAPRSIEVAHDDEGDCDDEGELDDDDDLPYYTGGYLADTRRRRARRTGRGVTIHSTAPSARDLFQKMTSSPVDRAPLQHFTLQPDGSVVDHFGRRYPRTT